MGHSHVAPQARKILKLEAALSRKQHEISELVQEQRTLRAREAVLQISAKQTACLGNLLAVLRPDTEPQTPGCLCADVAVAHLDARVIGGANSACAVKAPAPDPTNDTCSSSSSIGSSGMRAACTMKEPPVCQACPIPLSNAEAGALLAQRPGRKTSHEDIFKQPMAVRWWEEAVSSLDCNVQSSLGNMANAIGTAEGLRANISRDVQRLSCLLMRIRTGAPDAEAARGHLLRVCATMLLRCNMVALGEGARSLWEVMLGPLDAEYPSVPWGGLPQGPPPPLDYCVKQMGLSPEQEELAAELVGEWRSRSNAMARRREALLARAWGREGGAEASSPARLAAGFQEALVRDLAASQRAEAVNLAVFSLVLYDSLLTEEQFATFAVAAFPYAPPFAAVADALGALVSGHHADTTAAARP